VTYHTGALARIPKKKHEMLSCHTWL